MVLLPNNAETIHIHSMAPCRRGASRPPRADRSLLGILL